MKKSRYDVAIIGAGVVGAAVARYLSQFDLDVIWIEKESDVCMGTSCANSAIIHAGYDAKCGTLKSRLNVRGNQLWHELVGLLHIEADMTGSYVVALNDEEAAIVEELYHNGIENGVEKLSLVPGEELIKKIPQLSAQAKCALKADDAFVIDPFGATLALAENAVVNGIELSLETEFLDFILSDGKVKGISTSIGDIECDWVINSAGLYSDSIMHKAGLHPDFKISPRKGEYIVFDSSHIKMREVLFPVPTDKGKGILVTTTAHGNLMVGPNSVAIDDKEDKEITEMGMMEVFVNAKRMIPSLDNRYAIAEYSGLRATGNLKPNKDFLIEASDEIAGLVNLAGIESPGFASAPAIAEYVSQLMEDKGLKLDRKSGWIPGAEPKPRLRKMNHQQREELIRSNPAYGRIVCRCENVSEGEIVDAICSVIPATNYDAIKRRTWLGTGRCRGGFDYSRTIEILARELNISVTEVTKKGKGSEIIYRGTKDCN